MLIFDPDAGVIKIGPIVAEEAAIDARRRDAAPRKAPDAMVGLEYYLYPVSQP